MPEKTINQMLKDKFEAKYADAVVRHFTRMVQDYQQREWEDATAKAGRFVEAVVKAIWRQAGEVVPIGKHFSAGKILTQTENKMTLTDSLRLTIPRACRFAYEVASNRGARHDADEIEANEMDARAVLALCSWILGEMVRYSQHGLDLVADGKLKKIFVQGGAAVTLCDASDDRGGSWGEDGTIVFTPSARVALSKISSAGGTPQPLTTLDTQAGEVTHRLPQVLPGGKAVLFTSSTLAGGASFEEAEVVVYSMASGQRKTLQRGGFYARYLPSGHIVYMHDGTLFAVPFDLRRLEVTGQPAPILEGVLTNSYGGAQFSFADTGNLVYVAGHVGQNVSIYWMDREGKFTPLRETPGNYYNPAFSPDGKRLALDIIDGRRRDIWVDEWERDTLTRLTFAGEGNSSPVWTPDGQRITYSSVDKAGLINLWWIRSDGAGDAQRLTESKRSQYARSWRPDGKVLAFNQLNPGTDYDIMTLSIEGDEKSGWKPGEPKSFVNSRIVQSPAFSPDGRWLAYHSTESGNYEVYVRPFPGPGGKWQISTGGGVAPEWSHNGKELFYRTPDSKIMVVPYTASGDSFRADKPQLWSPGQFTDRAGSYNFDLHPDGKRFAVLKAPGTEQTAAVNKVSFIFNFFDEIRRKFPTGK
jgi:Tol biopolymer transport system component